MVFDRSEKVSAYDEYRIKLITGDIDDRKAWDAAVASLGGSIFHMSIWADYITAGQPTIVPHFFLFLRRNESVVGCALGFSEFSRVRIMKPFTRHLWFDSTPLVSSEEPDAMSVFLHLIQDHARRYGCARLSFGSFASQSRGKRLAAMGFDLNRRIEFIIQLNHSEDELWQALNGRRKRSVRSAIKKNVTIEHLDSDHGLIELRRLHRDSARRILKRGGPDLISGKPIINDPMKVLVQADAAKVIGARVNGAIVSAAIFLHANRHVFYMMAGQDQAGLKTNAASLLLWESLRYYKSNGASVFNLGGCSEKAVNETSPEYGVYVFKKGFGGRMVECASGHKVLKKLRFRIGKQLRGLFGH